MIGIKNISWNESHRKCVGCRFKKLVTEIPKFWGKYVIYDSSMGGVDQPLCRSVVTTFFKGKPSRIALRISVPTNQ